MQARPPRERRDERAPVRTVAHLMTPPRLSPALALLATLLALSALLGWALDIAALKRGLASSVAMNPVTAVCLALLGLEAFRMNALKAHAALAKAGQLAILVVVAAGLGELSDLIFGTSFSIDETLFGAALNAEARYPSRMAPNTAACLVLLGVALQLMRGGTDNRVRNAQLLAILVLLAGLLALAGNLFGVRGLSGPLQYIPMAFNTALAVCFIAASVLSYSRHKGLLKFVRWESIQIRVTLGSMAVFVTGVWSLTLYSSSVLHDDLQRQLGAQQFSTVSLLAEEIDQDLGARLRALETIGAEFTPAMLRDPALLQAVLDQRPLLRPLFNGGVMVLSGDGTALADVPRLAGRRGRNYMDNTDIAAAIKGAKATISQPVIGRALKAPAFGITVPVRDAQDRVIGAMVGLTDLSQSNFLDKITKNRYGDTGDYVLAGKKHRLVVTSSDKSRIMTMLPPPGTIPEHDYYFQGGEGSYVFVNPLGVQVLASLKHIPAAEWMLAAILPIEEAFAPIDALNRRHLMVALLFTLLAGAVTWWMMRRQLAPLLATVHTLATLAESEQPIQTLPVTRQDEIGVLIGGFNRLLKSLSDRTQSLRLTRAGVEAVSDGVFWMTADGRIMDVNEAACRTLGRTREAMLNAMVWEIDSAWSPQAWSQHFAELRQRGSLQFEADQRHPDGRVIPVEIVASYVKAGDQEFNCAFVRDISARKLAEIQISENANRRLKEQAAALEAQRQARLAALNLLEDARAARAEAESAGAALAERNEQLGRFNRVAVDRELDMIGLKRQMNALARELERAEPFNLAFADAPPAPGNTTGDSSPPAANTKEVLP